ncbi:MAG: C69 family dipeptidase [Bacteroidetes bacterium]|nr:C69 family dipeptidase [Bacteroidota bacterium]
MCDTLVALSNSTANRSVLFAKNSDREPYEAQALLHVGRQSYSEPDMACTYRRIPQVAETYECILSKPFQMWGAEMGVNEWGLAIGNEAVFTKVKFDKQQVGLTGMDILRLALERCRTADEAVNAMTSLLEMYGQDACGGYRNRKFYYHNSFLIADPSEAWVVETAGRAWVSEKVKDIRSISNRLSIDTAERLSEGAKANASRHRWWNGREPFSFRKSYSDWLYTTAGRAASRQAKTTSACKRQEGKVDAAACMNILQTHNIDHPSFQPSRANTGSVCMHATGLLNPSQTTGSMVAELRTDGPHTVWLTGTSMPCLSVYVPYFPGTATLKNMIQPLAEPDESLWWQAEKLHRWICRDYRSRRMLFEEQRVQLQRDFLESEKILIARKASPSNLEQFSNECLSRVLMMIRRWSSAISGEK